MAFRVQPEPITALCKATNKRWKAKENAQRESPENASSLFRAQSGGTLHLNEEDAC